jgi:hypothetical protein
LYLSNSNLSTEYLLLLLRMSISPTKTECFVGQTDNNIIVIDEESSSKNMWNEILEQEPLIGDHWTFPQSVVEDEYFDQVETADFLENSKEIDDFCSDNYLQLLIPTENSSCSTFDAPFGEPLFSSHVCYNLCDESFSVPDLPFSPSNLNSLTPAIYQYWKKSFNNSLLDIKKQRFIKERKLVIHLFYALNGIPFANDYLLTHISFGCVTNFIRYSSDTFLLLDKVSKFCNSCVETKGIIIQAFGYSFKTHVLNTFLMENLVIRNSLLQFDAYDIPKLRDICDLLPFFNTECPKRLIQSILNALKHFFNRENKTVIGILENVLLDSVKPLLQMIGNWIYCGELNDPFGEFFVSKTLSQASSFSFEVDSQFVLFKNFHKIILIGGKSLFISKQISLAKGKKISTLINKNHDLVHKFLMEMKTIFNRKDVQFLDVEYFMDIILGELITQQCLDSSVYLLRMLYEYNLYSHLRKIQEIFFLRNGLNENYISFYPDRADCRQVYSAVDCPFLSISPDGKKLQYQAPWPLNSIITTLNMDICNEILGILLETKTTLLILEKPNFIKDKKLFTMDFFAWRLRLINFVGAFWNYFMRTVILLV